MKLKFLVVLILFLTVIGQAATPPQTNGPLTKDEVMNLVKYGMSGADLAKKIMDLGIDFDLTDDYLQALRQAGAPEVVIEALRGVRPKPLTREQVGKLVAGGVPSQRAAVLVGQHGIDFLPDEEYLKTLRLAGADDTLIAALRTAGEAVTAQLEIETSPSAAVYLDGQLAGRAGADGRFAWKAKASTHALRVSLAGKQDFEQSLTLIAGQVNKSAAALAEVEPAPGTVKTNPKDGLKYVWIPPGSFQMGCSPGDNECQDNEKPAHQVTITKRFWLGQTEVTVGAYKHFAAATGRQMPAEPVFFRERRLNPGRGDEAMPIVDVTWDDAQAYCSWAGGRLPTEAEWEYAARAGSTEARYGSHDEVAWYSANSGEHPHPVGVKRANGFGLFDMLGNVWEWVNDWYGENYYQNSPSQNPSGPTSGTPRVLRGGSWVSNPSLVCASFRDGLDPGYWYSDFGFRCGGEVFAP
jgi:formylglycine-generating enzyme required for sulfatase activity